MKNRLATLLLVALIASSIVTAQTYRIRANRGLNLRADSSLQSRVVDTVRSGEILQVVGSANSWLKIDRDGMTAWLADWTDYSRVDEPAHSSAQLTQPSSAPIDNCCFVDRQCSSEQEWTNGFFVFQNGECPVPPQLTISAPSAPASSPIAVGGRPQPLRPESVILQLPWSATDWSRVNAPGVNNCCEAGWDCENGAEWQRGFHLYEASHCHHSALTLQGSENFRAAANRALEGLRVEAPHWYNYIIRGLWGIEQVPPDAGSGIHPQTRTYVQAWAGNEPMDDWSFYDFLGGMAHEACHIHMWNRGLAVASWTNELPCIEAQVYVTEAVDPINRHSAWLRDLITNLHDPAYWWW